MDPKSLTDTELRAALVSAGVAVGPITANTRKLFENRLRRLQSPSEESITQSDAVEDVKLVTTLPVFRTDDTEHGLEDADAAPEPKSYFGVACASTEQTAINGDEFVFGRVLDALKAVKAHPGARFKEFPTKMEAIQFASQPVPSTPLISEPISQNGVSSAFHGPKQPELNRFRMSIEKGRLDEVRNYLWSNPRYLISGGDTPVVLQVACRYNALHVCALKNQPALATLIIDTLSEEEFMNTLYPQDTASACAQRINHMLDLYLNTPDKGNCETPLHFACKFGNIDVIQVLLKYPMTNRILLNIHGESPEQVTCTRTPGNAINKQEIIKLLQATCLVPLLRPSDKSRVAVVGEPLFITNPVTTIGSVFPAQPCSAPLVIDAYAGPMSPTEAQKFRKKWMAHASVEDRKQFLSICCKDDEKGQERIGRMLAAAEGVKWCEYWDFLEEAVDLSTQGGLSILEEYLEQRLVRDCNISLSMVTSNSNTTLCAPSPSEETIMFESNTAGPNSSFTNNMDALGDALDKLNICSPGNKTKITTDLENNQMFVENIGRNLWKEPVESNSVCRKDVADNNHNASPCEDNVFGKGDPAPVCAQIPEKCIFLVPDCSLSQSNVIHNRLDKESDEESDYASCVSLESGVSRDTYYTATVSPIHLAPPHTPSRQTAVFLIGQEPTKVDTDVLHALEQTAITPEFPNVSRWHRQVTAYSEEARNNWSSPRRDQSRSTSKRSATHSRAGAGTPTSTPGRTPNHLQDKATNALRAVRINLLSELVDADSLPNYI